MEATQLQDGAPLLSLSYHTTAGYIPSMQYHCSTRQYHIRVVLRMKNQVGDSHHFIVHVIEHF
jgi:hypothetical protein